jgi:DNA-binding PadR family transcriptional regulator
MQEVLRQSDGRYKLGPGTLYDNLQKLLSGGLVEEAPRATDDYESAKTLITEYPD